MHAKRGWQFSLLGCFAFSSVLVLVAQAGSTPREDHAWKLYRNPQWGYCVSYPARWSKGDAFEGAGLYVKTGVTKRSYPTGEMDVTALPNTLEASVQPASTFGDDVRLHLEGLKKFEREEQVELVEQRPMTLFGLSALFAKERYYDPRERAKWAQEVVFAQRENVLYRMELVCRDDQLVRFEPVFTRLISTFQADCAAQH